MENVVLLCAELIIFAFHRLFCLYRTTLFHKIGSNWFPNKSSCTILINCRITVKLRSMHSFRFLGKFFCEYYLTFSMFDCNKTMKINSVLILIDRVSQKKFLIEIKRRNGGNLSTTSADRGSVTFWSKNPSPLGTWCEIIWKGPPPPILIFIRNFFRTRCTTPCAHCTFILEYSSVIPIRSPSAQTQNPLIS